MGTRTAVRSLFVLREEELTFGHRVVRGPEFFGTLGAKAWLLWKITEKLQGTRAKQQQHTLTKEAATAFLEKS